MSSTSISRRQMIGATALGIASAHAFIRSARAAGAAEPVIIGEGAHRYQVLHDWARLPARHAFGNTHGVAVDTKGFLHVAHTVHASSQSPDAVCVFDPEGGFARSWGPEYRGGAHGLTLVKEPTGDCLFHCDCNKGVVRKTDLDGKTLIDYAWPAESGCYETMAEYKPTNLAVVPHDAKDADGSRHPLASHVFVADGYGKSWIHLYDPAGKYLHSFAGPGAERGQTSCPHGIAIDTRLPGQPRLLVADRSNRRLQYFSLGAHALGRHLGFVKEGVRSPCHFDQFGDLLLVPDLEARVTILGLDDKPVAQLGDGTNFALRDKPRDQFVPGKFIAPHSACFDAKGNIFVVEWVEIGRVTKLVRI